MLRHNPFIYAFLLIVPVFFVVPQLCAQSAYYIDYSNGNNSNPGTKALPWKTHPSMNPTVACTKSGTAPAYTHVSGDRFYFKGGIIWPNACFQMYVNQGGTSTLLRDYYGIEKDEDGVITWYDPASSEPGCTDPALVISAGDGQGTTWEPKIMRSSCLPVFDGGVTQIAAGKGSANGYLVWVRANHVEFDNIEMRNLLILGDAPLAAFLSFTEGSDGYAHHLYLHGQKVYTAAIDTISKTGDIVTVSTSVPHHLASNVSVTVEGTGSMLDGSYSTLIIDSPTQFHFTYAPAGKPDVETIRAGNVLAGIGNNFALTAWNQNDVVGDAIEISNTEWNEVHNGAGAVHVSTLTNSIIHDTATMVLGGSTVIANVFYNACWCPRGNNCPIYDRLAHTNGIFAINETTIANNLIYNFACNAAPIFPSPDWSDKYCTAKGGLGTSLWVYNNTIKQGAGPAIVGYVMDIGGTFGTSPCNDYHILNNTIEQNAVVSLVRLGERATCVGPSCKAVRLFEWKNNHSITSDGIAHLNYNSPGYSYCVTCDVSSNVAQTISEAATQGYTDANNYATASGQGSTVRAGVNLSSLGIDRLNIGRPAPPGLWDVGAYQYLKQPENLKVIK